PGGRFPWSTPSSRVRRPPIDIYHAPAQANVGGTSSRAPRPAGGSARGGCSWVSLAGRFPALRRADWPALVVTVVAGILTGRNLIAIVQFIQRRPLEGVFALYYVFARIGLHHGWGSLYVRNARACEWP